MRSCRTTNVGSLTDLDVPCSQTPSTLATSNVHDLLHDRVGAADLRHHRRAEDGRPQLRQPDGADRRRPGTGRRRRVGHVLRHPPVWRAPDLSPGRPRPRILRAVRCRRVDRRVSRAARRARGDARVGDAVALASRADEPGRSRDRAALHPPVGRNRGPGDPERPPRRSTRRPASAMPSPRRKPASDSKSTTGSRGFRRAWSARPATCRSRSTMVRCGSVPRGLRSGMLGEERLPRSPMTTASSTPATWWNAAATATTSSVDGAASSTSED